MSTLLWIIVVLALWATAAAGGVAGVVAFFGSLFGGVDHFSPRMSSAGMCGHEEE